MVEKPPNPFGESLEKKPGSYQLILRSTSSVVDPGDELGLELYISGFGNMQFSKLVFYPSANVFSSSSEVLFGPDLDQKEGTLYWGGQKAQVSPQGGLIELTVLTPEVLFIFKPRLQVITERNTTKKKDGKTFAPVQFNLKIKNKARPGKYHMHFILTYFDGEKWNTSSTKFQFSVRNLLERYASFAWWLAITAGVGAIIAAVPDIPKIWHLLVCLFL